MAERRNLPATAVFQLSWEYSWNGQLWSWRVLAREGGKREGEGKRLTAEHGGEERGGFLLALGFQLLLPCCGGLKWSCIHVTAILLDLPLCKPSWIYPSINWPLTEINFVLNLNSSVATVQFIECSFDLLLVSVLLLTCKTILIMVGLYAIRREHIVVACEFTFRTKVNFHNSEHVYVCN